MDALEGLKKMQYESVDLIYADMMYDDLNLTWIDECFRVLKDEGILIFKWNECDVPLKEVLKLTTYKPLFGHPSGKAQKTHWVCFMKLPFNGI